MYKSFIRTQNKIKYLRDDVIQKSKELWSAINYFSLRSKISFQTAESNFMCLRNPDPV